MRIDSGLPANQILITPPRTTFQSNDFLRLTVPGQISYDLAIEAYINGEYLNAILFGTSMLAEQTFTVLTLGQGDRINRSVRASFAAGGRFLGPSGPIFGDTAFGAVRQGVLNSGRIRAGFGRHGGRANFRIGINSNKIDLFSVRIPRGGG